MSCLADKLPEMVKMFDQCFPKPKITSASDLFYPHPKNIKKSSRWSVRQEESFMSFVCSVAFPAQQCLAVNRVMHSSQLLVLK